MEFGTGDSKKRLGISGVAEAREVVDKCALEQPTGAELLHHVMVSATKKINDFVCATCANCESMEVKSEQFEDHANMRTVVAMRAGCKRAMGRVGSPECPDGFNLHERGWKAGVKTEEVASYGDHIMGRVVTGYEYSETSPDPLTMNHLTVHERARQCDTLRRAIELGHTSGRYDRTRRETTFELEGRQVTFHEDGKVTGRTMRGKPESSFTSNDWVKDRQGRPLLSAANFNRDYLNDFGTDPRLPTKPKDLPTAPDAGTW